MMLHYFTLTSFRTVCLLWESWVLVFFKTWKNMKPQFRWPKIKEAGPPANQNLKPWNLDFRKNLLGNGGVFCSCHSEQCLRLLPSLPGWPVEIFIFNRRNKMVLEADRGWPALALVSAMSLASWGSDGKKPSFEGDSHGKMEHPDFPLWNHGKYGRNNLDTIYDEMK